MPTILWKRNGESRATIDYGVFSKQQYFCWIEDGCFVFGIQNNDLSNPDQCVSKIGVKFKHDFLGDVVMEVISPEGQVITLIGPLSQGLQGQDNGTAGTLFDVGFVPAGEVPMPNGFEPKWDNDQEWRIIGRRTGTFFPFKGNLEDFNMGRVNGTWTLRVRDLSAQGNDEGELLDWYVEFCDS